VRVEREEDFSEYVHARWTALTRSAVFLGCSPHEAEDLVQTTLMRCYASWDKVMRAEHRDAYVYRVLVNVHTSSRRRRWWTERPTAAVPEAEGMDPTTEVDAADALRAALGALSPANRAAVILRYYAQLSEAEIAQVLGIAPGTVKSRLSRGLAQMSSNANLTDRPTETPHD
jgi:RNA polymerase sigma-70 factor (sigma-E family)